MEVKTLKIQGMSCGHCVMQVKKELSKVARVRSVQLGSATVEIDPVTVPAETLKAAVESAGYVVEKIS